MIAIRIDRSAAHRAAWIVLAGAAWLIATAMPLAAAMLFVGTPETRVHAIEVPLTSVLIRSVLWHTGAALLCLALAWPMARWMEVGMSHRTATSARLIAPIATALLAPWILFAAWWTILAPGNPIHDWLASHGHGTALRRTTLLLGIVGWGWAPAALVLALGRSGREDSGLLLDRLDGLRGLQRWSSAMRRNFGVMAMAFLVVVLALGADTVCFDLAQEPSIGFELRSLEAQGAAADTILRAGWPMLALSTLMVAALSTIAIRRSGERRGSISGDATVRGSSTRGALLVPTAIIVVALPIALLAWRVIQDPQTGFFLQLHGRGAANALGTTLCVALLGGALAGVHAELASRAPRGARFDLAAVVTVIMLAGWTLVAGMPASLYAAACQRAWSSSPLTQWMLDVPAALIIGQFGRFAIVAALLGMLLGRRWARHQGELDRLDGSERSLVATVISHRRLHATATLGGAVALGALAAGEISVAARLEPPGFDWLASSVLSAIHYQRPGSVAVAIVAAALLALAAAAALAIVIVPRRQLASTGARLMGLLFILHLAMVGGCDRTQAQDCPPLPRARQLGGPGVVDGSFERPRAIARDPRGGSIVVIDKTARVQRFGGAEFERSFRMPDSALGQPVGVSVLEDGTVIVPDTHYHRVIRYDSEGRELGRFGKYGFGDGEFIYPTDVAVAPDGSLFVGEYGGNDRIQVFDAEGRFLRVLGRAGSEPGAFERPQSLAFSADGSELFVVDACNHRIQVLEPSTGEVRRVLGSLGRGPGELGYPWAVDVLADGSLLVVEWGNDRIQRLDPSTGRSLALFGGKGRELGRLWQPWALAIDGEVVHVVDTGNSRIQTIPLAELGVDTSAPRPGR